MDVQAGLAALRTVDAAQRSSAQDAPAGMAPARSNGEEAAEFHDDRLAFWTATLHG